MADPLAIPARALLDRLVDPVIGATSEGLIVYANPAAEVLLGSTALAGAPLASIVPERLRPQHTKSFNRFVGTRTGRLVGGHPVRVPAQRADGTEVEVELSISAFENEEADLVLVGTLRDLADRVELERQRDVARYLSISREVTTRLALGVDAGSLEEAAPTMLEVLGEGLGWSGGAVWAPRDGHLLPVATWGRQSTEMAITMTSGVRFAAGQGLPGHVYATGEADWIETVSTSTIFTRRARAEDVGVRSVFAFPIYVVGAVEGVVEMYSESRQPPEPELLAILQAAGLEIGRYLERAQARRHLLEMAEALQTSLLPPQPPMIPGVDIAVRYRAASGEGHVGGDFFDVFPLPDGEWVVLIGDVSGRGPRAAALTALARYTLRAAAVGSPSPSAALRVLNDVVRRELEASLDGDERFLTAAYLTIAPAAEGFRVAVACGGHPHPLARRASGDVEEVPCDGELIGAFDAHEARDEVVALRAGDAVVLVTDGVLEARSSSGEQFGDDRLREVIASCGTDAASIADAIDAAVVAHVGGVVQDDVAIVVLRLPEGTASDTALNVRVAESPQVG
jgi:PAS domain S-box-containing protein